MPRGCMKNSLLNPSSFVLSWHCWPFFHEQNIVALSDVHHMISDIRVHRILCCLSYIVVLSCLCTCPHYCAAKHMAASWELKEGSLLVDSLQFGSKFCSMAMVLAVTSRSDISSHCIVSLSTAFCVCHCPFAWHVSRPVEFFMIAYLLARLPIE